MPKLAETRISTTKTKTKNKKTKKQKKNEADQHDLTALLAQSYWLSPPLLSQALVSGKGGFSSSVTCGCVLLCLKLGSKFFWQQQSGSVFDCCLLLQPMCQTSGMLHCWFCCCSASLFASFLRNHTISFCYDPFHIHEPAHPTLAALLRPVTYHITRR